MLKIHFNSRQFQKEMNNIINYSIGFVDGIGRGKKAMYTALGPQISELASQFIDANARVSPELLHHVYEWHRTGSPEARLFDIDFTVSNLGLTFKSSLKQSTSIKNGSNVPFYNKAQIMENGIGVTIKPTKSQVLRFEIDGQEIFTPNEVRVENPGGQTQGQFKNVVSNFFGVYFRQSFLEASGLGQYFKYPKVYAKNLNAGKRGGRAVGLKAGYQWVVNAGVVR
jgi:hypothetical protein